MLVMFLGSQLKILSTFKHIAIDPLTVDWHGTYGLHRYFMFTNSFQIHVYIIDKKIMWERKPSLHPRDFLNLCLYTKHSKINLLLLSLLLLNCLLNIWLLVESKMCFSHNENLQTENFRSYSYVRTSIERNNQRIVWNGIFFRSKYETILN